MRFLVVIAKKVLPRPIFNALRAIRWYIFSTPLEKKMVAHDRFMRKEVANFATNLQKHTIKIHGQEHLLGAAAKSAVIAGLLHYGCWSLTGISISSQLELPYNVIASYRHRYTLFPKDKYAWERGLMHVQDILGHQIFYNDQSPRFPLEWLKTKGNVLGMNIDVREAEKIHKEYPFDFLGKKIYLQVGPARMAILANVPIVPTIVQFDPKEKVHHLYIDEPVYPNNDPQAMTQQVLLAFEKHVKRALDQQNVFEITSKFGKPT
jgi:lauroyl/myristoyl acyltransferase